MTPHSNSSSVHLSEEDMAKIKNKVLEVLRAQLVDHIDPRRFVTYLRAHSVLDQRECDEIKSASGRSRCEGAEKFLDVLATKSSHGYDQFCNAIMKDKTQMFLLTALNKKVELYKDYRRKQIAKDYEMWKKEQELQQKKQFHLLIQHKQHAAKLPRPMDSHAPQITLPPHIYYPPNYHHDELSVSQPPCRARSPIPFAGSDNMHMAETNTLDQIQTHNGLVVFQGEPHSADHPHAVIPLHQPWSQYHLTSQPPNIQGVLPQDTMIRSHQYLAPSQLQVHTPLQITRDCPTGEGEQ